MQMFPQLRVEICCSLPHSTTNLLRGFLVCYITEIYLQLKCVWAEIADVQYLTLSVTEIPRIFIHS